MVYIKEAHALDSASPGAYLAIEDPISDEERTEVCVRCIDDLKLPIPAVVDDMDDTVNRAYGAYPDRMYLIGRDGRVAFAGEPGPRGFSPEQLEEAIQTELDGPRPPRSRLLAALDSDGDGKLSATEIASAAESLQKLDADGDGQLSPEELADAPAPRPVPPPGDPRDRGGRGMLTEMDRNGDGKLSREELPERMRQRFEFMDANKDGFVDGDEMRRMMEQRRGGRGGRGGGRDGDDR